MGNASSADAADGGRSGRPPLTTTRSTSSVQYTGDIPEAKVVKTISRDLSDTKLLKTTREKSMRNILLSNPVDSDLGPLVLYKDGSCQTDEDLTFWFYADYWIVAVVVIIIAYFYYW